MAISPGEGAPADLNLSAMSALAVVILHDRPGLGFAIGAPLIVAAVVTASFAKGRPRDAPRRRLLLLSVAHSGSALRARSMKVRSAGFVVSARAASNALLASSLRETLLSSSARTAWNR